jgi:hypothetical protein
MRAMELEADGRAPAAMMVIGSGGCLPVLYRYLYLFKYHWTPPVRRFLMVLYCHTYYPIVGPSNFAHHQPPAYVAKRGLAIVS